MGWKSIRDNIKAAVTDSLSYYEKKQHKPEFDDECSEVSDKRKQDKMQWLQN
jgi:hypothetical protein